MHLRVHRDPLGDLFNDWDHGGIAVHGGFQIILYAEVGGPDPDPFRFDMQSKYIARRQSIHSSTYVNYSGLHDRVIDRDFDLAGRSPDPKTRAGSYAEIQRRVNTLVYRLDLYFLPAYRTDDRRVRNFAPSPAYSNDEWNIYSWQAGG